MRRICECTRTSLRTATIEVYGSHATKLSLPWSDIDLVLKPGEDQTNQALEELYNELGKHDWVKEKKLIMTASVPVAKLECEIEGQDIKVDITFQDGNHLGKECVSLVQKYLSMKPHIEPLLIVLKQLLKIYKLNDTYYGGISSYGLLLMLVAFLQVRYLLLRPCGCARHVLTRDFFL